MRDCPSKVIDRTPRSLLLLLVTALTILFALGPVGRPALAADGFAVENFDPQGEAKAPYYIRVKFTAPVIGSADIGLDVKRTDSPIRISPHIPGIGRWVNPLTFVYQPSQNQPQMGAKYNVTVRESLKDLDGNPIKGNRTFEFTTPPVTIESARQTAYNIGNDVIDYDLIFSALLSLSDFQANFSVVDSGGDVIKYLMYPKNNDNIFRISIPAGDGSDVIFRFGYPRTDEGGKSEAKESEVRIQRDKSIRVSNSNLYSDYGRTYLQIETTLPANTSNVASFIEIKPDIKFVAEIGGSSIMIYADFKPREFVTVKLKKGLPSQGAPLAEDWVRSFLVPDLDPSVEYPYQGRFLSPVGESFLLPVDTVNIDELNVSVRRVYDNNIPFVMRGSWPYDAYELSEALSEETYTIDAPENERVKNALDVAKLTNGKRGLFEIRAGKKNNWPQMSRFFNITDIGGSVKISKNGILAWANSISKGEALKNVTVTAYTRSHQVLAEGKTNGKGLWSHTFKENIDEINRPDLLVFKNGDDVSVLRVDNSIWSGTDESYEGVPYSNQEYQVLCYTPRGIFRPGETVPVNVLLRDRKFELDKPFPIVITLITPEGREWVKKTVELSEVGMAVDENVIPVSAPTGWWHALVTLPGSSQSLARASFMVDDFAPPRITVALSHDKAALFKNDNEGTLSIQADYLFGAKGADLAYEAELTIIPREYADESLPGFRFANDRLTFSSETSTIGNGFLSADGAAIVNYTVNDYKLPSMADLLLRAGVMEDSGRWVYKTLSLPYYESAKQFGIRLPDGYITAGTPAPVAFAVSGPDGRGTDEAARMTVYKIHERVTQTSAANGRRYEVHREYIKEENYTDVDLKFEGGLASADITFATRGEYLIEIMGDDDIKSAARSVYVGSAGWVYSDSQAALPEKVTLTLDKERYRKGDKANVKIEGAFSGSVLLTVETDEILLHETIRAVEGTANYTFTVTEEMTPNAWVAAQLIRPVEAEETWGAHRAFGAVPLSMDTTPMKMEVEILLPDRVMPDAKNDFTVMLTDGNGKPLVGEVCVMLVDEGVLSLTNYSTPNPYEYFTRKRGLMVEAYDIYDDLLPLLLNRPPLLRPGGGYAADEVVPGVGEKSSLSPVKAERFKIVADWKLAKSDQNGKAQLSFDIPEFNGKLRVMAVAAAKKAFGCGEASATVNRDVVAECALPRAAAPGDVFEAQINLYNMTEGDKSVAVKLSIEGPLTVVGGYDDNAPGAKNMTKELKLKGGKENSSSFTQLFLKAGPDAGVAYLTLETKVDGESALQRVELPIRPPYPSISRSGAVFLEPGDDKTITIPDGFLSGTGRTFIAASGMPDISLTDVALFLREYPYGCVEQTISSTWVLLALPELVAGIDPTLVSESVRRDQIVERLYRLQAMQLYNGSFPSWQWGEANNWVTVYAAHFMIECMAQGIPVSEGMFSRTVAYLESMLMYLPDRHNLELYGADLGAKSYAAYVLAISGRTPHAWLSYLIDNVDSIPAYGRVMLAAAAAAGNDKAAARKLLPRETPAIVRYEPAETEMYNYDSQLRTLAIQLLSWCELDPTSAETSACAMALLQSVGSAGRMTTQEAAFTAISLSKYFAYNRGEGKADLELTAETDDIHATVAGDETFNRRSDGLKSLKVSNRGEGRGYVFWTTDGVPLEAPEPENSGLAASITYYDRTGFKIESGSTVERGQKIKGTVKVTPLSGSARNLVVVVPFAAGLEVENPKLTGSSYAGSSDSYRVSRSELRDDRLLLFIDDIDRPLEWSFEMRAVTSGNFTLPPIAAEGMYSPGTYSIGATGIISVR